MDKPKYDTGYFDEEESVKEVSTRARRTRKGASDVIKPNLDRQTSKQSLDDLSKKDSALKRRGTSKKSELEKKLSDVKSDESEAKAAEAESKDDKEDDKLDEKNVVFCMWGHENCRTRSHYRYNWQWDYVQKYAEQTNKHLVHGFIPKEKDQPSVRKMAQDAEKAKEEKEKEEKQKEEDKKPGKEGIRSRMKMLQNKFTAGKASESVKQHIFERDLELEMLRRKKNYQQKNSGSG